MSLVFLDWRNSSLLCPGQARNPRDVTPPTTRPAVWAAVPATGQTWPSSGAVKLMERPVTTTTRIPSTSTPSTSSASPPPGGPTRRDSDRVRLGAAVAGDDDDDYEDDDDDDDDDDDVDAD